MAEEYTCAGSGATLKLSVLSTQFCYKPKIALKNKIYFLKVQNFSTLLEHKIFFIIFHEYFIIYISKFWGL